MNGLAGYTEIRKANVSQLVDHAQELINGIEMAGSWQEWALENIPGLKTFEIDQIKARLQESVLD